jgi:hypothetical protein
VHTYREPIRTHDLRPSDLPALWNSSATEWPVHVGVYAAGDAAGLLARPDSVLAAQLRETQMIATNATVAVTAQIESASGPCARWTLDPAARFGPEPFAETAKGDANELAEFARWTNLWFPAERRVLVLCGQGASWREECVQSGLQANGLLRPEPRFEAGLRWHACDLFGRRAISAQESRATLIEPNATLFPDALVPTADLGLALERAALAHRRRFDVVAFDTYQVASLETLCEVAESTRAFVAAVDGVSAAPLDLAAACRRITEVASPVARDLAEAFVHPFAPRAPWDGLVAVDLEGPAFGKALDAFVTFAFNLHKWVRAESERAAAVRQALAEAARAGDRKRVTLVDVADLIEPIAQLGGIPANVKTSLKSFVDNLREATIARTSGHGLGISLVVPRSVEEYRASRSDSGRTRLAVITRWDRVLDALFLD